MKRPYRIYIQKSFPISDSIYIHVPKILQTKKEVLNEKKEEDYIFRTL